MSSQNFNEDYCAYAVKDFYHRYLPYRELMRYYNDYYKGDKEQVGESYLGQSIYKISIGKGKKRIFIWTQMHGNESTGTRAMFDIIAILQSSSAYASIIREMLTVEFILMLNPDGADRYQRRNAMGIDMNRDFTQQKTPEINILTKTVEKGGYHCLFNLHDQRSIFSAGDYPQSATLSFLAPSYNKEREINHTRIKAMEVVVAMRELLKIDLPNKIGRYTDEFYPNATGDNFTAMGLPCVLIEAGYYPQDKERNHTRKYHAIALMAALLYLAENNDVQHTSQEKYKAYFEIPINQEKFLDIIIRNVLLKTEHFQTMVDIGLRYGDQLNEEGTGLISKAYIQEVGDLSSQYGHEDVDARGAEYQGKEYLIQGKEADFKIGDICFINGKRIP